MGLLCLAATKKKHVHPLIEGEQYSCEVKPL